MSNALDLKATDVSEAAWFELAGQMDSDFSVENYTAFCSTIQTGCLDGSCNCHVAPDGK